VGSTVGEEALQGGTVGEGSPEGGHRLAVVWSFFPALDVWDYDWLILGLLKAMPVVTDGMELEGRRSLQMHSAVLIQCLAQLFPEISDLQLGDSLDGGL
jgi:hypothetical protein